MKRLFTLKDERNKPYLSAHGHKEQIYFDSKQTARTVRNRLIEETNKPWYITLGPDHMGYHRSTPKSKNYKRSDS